MSKAAISMIEAAISNMGASKTALGYNEMDMKSLARIVFANWKHVDGALTRLSAEKEAWENEAHVAIQHGLEFRARAETAETRLAEVVEAVKLVIVGLQLGDDMRAILEPVVSGGVVGGEPK